MAGEATRRAVRATHPVHARRGGAVRLRRCVHLAPRGRRELRDCDHPPERAGSPRA